MYAGAEMQDNVTINVLFSLENIKLVVKVNYKL